MKRISLFIVLFVSFILLAACSSEESASGEGNQTEGSSQEESNTDNSESEEASGYPEETIEILVPYGAGGMTSNSIRILAEGAKKYIPNNVDLVLVNEPGATGSIAFTSLYNSEPDGYTIIGSTHSPILLAPRIRDTVYSKDDVRTIMQYAQAPPILSVQQDAPYSTFDEWLEHVQQSSETFTYGTTGPNSVAHILMQQLSGEVGVTTSHVPYESSSELLAALMGGHIDGIITTVDGSMAESSKQVFSFQSSRSELYPDVPTLLDNDINVSVDTFYGFFAPKDVSDEKVEILHDAFKQAIEDPEVLEQLNEINSDVMYRNAEDFQEIIDNADEQFEKIAEQQQSE